MRVFTELRKLSKSSLPDLFFKKTVRENFTKVKGSPGSLFPFLFVKKDTLGQVSYRCLLSMEELDGSIVGS